MIFTSVERTAKGLMNPLPIFTPSTPLRTISCPLKFCVSPQSKGPPLAVYKYSLPQSPYPLQRKPFISIAMPSPSFALPALFLLFLFPFSSAHSFHDDAQSLLAFKKLITSDPHNSLANWSPKVPLCNWTAITCGRRHPDRVVAIDLDFMDLRGTISPSLGNLSFLRSLNLSHNKLHGHIPPQFGRLFRLRWLWLSHNQLEGNIPHQLSSCRNLVSLALSYNNVSGNIPGELSSLLHLQELYLGANSLTDFCRFKNGALIPTQSQELRTISLFSKKFQCPVNVKFGVLEYARFP